jgi:hypothetical protein
VDDTSGVILDITKLAEKYATFSRIDINNEIKNASQSLLFSRICGKATMQGFIIANSSNVATVTFPGGTTTLSNVAYRWMEMMKNNYVAKILTGLSTNDVINGYGPWSDNTNDIVTLNATAHVSNFNANHFNVAIIPNVPRYGNPNYTYENPIVNSKPHYVSFELTIPSHIF